MSGFFQLQPGIVFAGDFRIVKLLAEGGMGAVYVAEQLSTGQQRALKVMQPRLLPDEKSRERFLTEARIGSRIPSDHVVQVLAAGVDAETHIPWLAMELLEGTDLDALVRQRGPLPATEALELLEQVGHALTEAHRQRIIHRDLKPENLFLAKTRRRGADSMVKVLDFGIAQLTELHRTAATVTSAIGSPLWMAPEQAQPGAKLRPATDVWALGLIAFYLLTGKSFWLSAHAESFSLAALLAEVLTLPIVPASERARSIGAPALPQAFDAWFARAVERDPTQRFADAGEALPALRHALESGSLPVAATAPMPSASASSPGSLAESTSPPLASPTQPFSPPDGWSASAAAPSGPIAQPARGGSWIALALVAVVLSGAGATFAWIGLSGDDEPTTRAARDPVRDEPDEPEDVPEAPHLSPYEAALADCQSALLASRYADALAHADRALAERPGDVPASACRTQAEEGQTFERGVEHMRRGDLEAAHFQFERLPDASPFRNRPQVAQVAQGYASAQLDEGQRLLSTSPDEALARARSVLTTRGIRADQRSTASALERAAQARLASPEPSRARAEPTPPPSNPFRTPSRGEAPAPAGQPANAEAEARQCVMVGDNACVIRLLEGRARTERELSMLIEAYRARGQNQQALRHMRTYVSRFPAGPRARQYQQILAMHGN